MNLFHNETDPVAEIPYVLTFERRPRYLYVNIRSDTINYQIARQYWDEIFEIRDRTGFKLILIDKDVRAELSFADAFQIAAEVAMWEHQYVKLAICDRHASQKAIRFCEIVAKNRGLYTQSFSDVDAAEQWLLSD